MLVAILVSTAVQATLQPAWTYEAAFGTESLVHVGFVSEKTLIYVTNLGMVGWIDTRKGNLVKFSRIGRQVVSGTRLGDRIWLRGPTNDLIEIRPDTAEIIRTHPIGKNIGLRVSDGSHYVLRSRFDQPIEVLKLPELSSVFTIPKEGSWRGAASSRTQRIAIVNYRNLSIWDADKKAKILELRLPLGNVLDIRFTPDDKQIAITYADWSGTVLYDAGTMKRLAGVKGTLFHPVFAHRLNALSHIGTSPGAYGRSPGLWVPGTGKQWELSPDEATTSAAFSDSDRLLALARKGTVTLYKVPLDIQSR